MARRSTALNRSALYYLEMLERSRGERSLASTAGEWPQLRRAIAWAAESEQHALLGPLLDGARHLLDELNVGAPYVAWAETRLRLVRLAEDHEAELGALECLADAYERAAETTEMPRLDALTAASRIRAELIARCDAEHADSAHALVALGLTMVKLGEVSPNERGWHLQGAIDQFDRALRAAPAGSQARRNALANRAIALKDLSTLPGRDRKALLREALRSLEAAERELLSSGAGEDEMGVTRLNLSNLLREPGLGWQEGSRERRHALRRSFQLIEGVIAGNGSILTRGRAWIARGNTLQLLALYPEEDPRACLLRALASTDEAAALFRDHPLLRANALNNRASILIPLSLVEGEDRAGRLRAAWSDLEEALEIRKGRAIEEISTRFNLAQVLLARMHAEGPGDAAALRAAFDHAAEAHRLAVAFGHGVRAEDLLQLVPRLRDEANALGLLAEMRGWWRVATGEPWPDSGEPGTATPRREDPLSSERRKVALQVFLGSPYASRLRMLKEHADLLLADETLELIEDMAGSPRLSPHVRDDMRQKSSFFRRCKAVGVDEAVREWEQANPDARHVPPEVLERLAVLERMGPEELGAYAREHPEEVAELEAGGWARVEVPSRREEDSLRAFETISAFLRAGTAAERVALLREHGEDLLSRSAEATIDAILADRANEPAKALHLAAASRLLERAREIGVERASEEDLAAELEERHWREPLKRLLAHRSFREARDVLLEHGDALAGEGPERELAMIADAQETEDARAHVEVCRAMIRRTRDLGARLAMSEAVVTYYAQATSEENRRALLERDLECVDEEHAIATFARILEANAGLPTVVPGLRRARRVLLRALEVGVEAAIAERRDLEERMERFVEAFGRLEGKTVEEGAALYRRDAAIFEDSEVQGMLRELVEVSTGASAQAPFRPLTVRSLEAQLRLLADCARLGPERAFGALSNARNAIGSLAASTNDREAFVRLARDHEELLLRGPGEYVLVEESLSRELAGRGLHPLLGFLDEWRAGDFESAVDGIVGFRERVDALSDFLDDLVKSSSWEEARGKLRAQQALLEDRRSRRALTALCAMLTDLEGRPDTGSRGSYRFHREMLERILERGVERTIAEFERRFDPPADTFPDDRSMPDPARDEEIAAALNGMMTNRSLAATAVYVEHHRALLLSDRAQDLLRHSLEAYRGNEPVVAAIAVVEDTLRLCRELGIRGAMAALRERSVRSERDDPGPARA